MEFTIRLKGVLHAEVSNDGDAVIVVDAPALEDRQRRVLEDVFPNTWAQVERLLALEVLFNRVV